MPIKAVKYCYKAEKNSLKRANYCYKAEKNFLEKRGLCWLSVRVATCANQNNRIRTMPRAKKETRSVRSSIAWLLSVGVTVCLLGLMMMMTNWPIVIINPTINVNNHLAVRSNMEMVAPAIREAICASVNIDELLDSYPWLSFILLAATYAQRLMCANLLE